MPRPFIGKRVVVVVICGMLVGGISAALAAASAIQPAAGASRIAQSSGSAQSSTSGTSTAPTSSSTSSPSSSATPTDTSVPQPTARPSSTATRVPRPTPLPTSTPPPGTTKLQGSVVQGSVNQTNGTFVLQTSSTTTVTVDTNGQTQYTGQAHSLNGLQGCSADVYVQIQTFLAVQVNATDC